MNRKRKTHKWKITETKEGNTENRKNAGPAGGREEVPRKRTNILSETRRHSKNENKAKQTAKNQQQSR